MASLYCIVCLLPKVTSSITTYLTPFAPPIFVFYGKPYLRTTFLLLSVSKL